MSITSGSIRYQECIRVRGDGPGHRFAKAEVSFDVPHGHDPLRYVNRAAVMALEQVRQRIGWKPRRGRPPKRDTPGRA